MLSSRFYFRAEGEIALLIKFFCRKHEDVNLISKPTYKDGHGGVCLQCYQWHDGLHYYYP